MKTRVVSATEFKAKCLALLHEVEQRGGPITITRRGPPKKTARKSPANSWAGKVEIVGDIVNGDPDLWDVAHGELSSLPLVR
jgi:antitoxin (DNA-binding transcriptional repressor) of toxin-antitoxin stability system